MPPSYFQRMLLFSDLELCFGGNLALGGFIQVGVAQGFAGVWWEVFHCKLLFNALALAVQTGTEGFGRLLIQYQRGPEPD